MRMNVIARTAQKESPPPGGPLSSVERSSVRTQTEASLFAPNQWSEEMVLSSPKYGYICTPASVTNQQVANEFAELLTDVSREEAAAAADRTVEAVKKWRARVQAPDSASLINSAARRPRVRAWLMWRIGGDPVLARSPQVLSELHQFLMSVGVGEGREAQEARRLYAEIFRSSTGNSASAQRLPGPMQSVALSADDSTPQTGGSQLSRTSGSFSEGRR
jgi:hypothetical protein